NGVTVMLGQDYYAWKRFRSYKLYVRMGRRAMTCGARSNKDRLATALKALDRIGGNIHSCWYWRLCPDIISPFCAGEETRRGMIERMSREEADRAEQQMRRLFDWLWGWAR